MVNKPFMNICYVEITPYTYIPNWEIYYPSGESYTYTRFEREDAYSTFFENGGIEDLIFEELTDEQISEIKKELWGI